MVCFLLILVSISLIDFFNIFIGFCLLIFLQTFIEIFLDLNIDLDIDLCLDLLAPISSSCD